MCVREKDNHNKNAEQKAKGKKVVITALKVLRDTKLCFFSSLFSSKAVGGPIFLIGWVN